VRKALGLASVVRKEEKFRLAHDLFETVVLSLLVGDSSKRLLSCLLLQSLFRYFKLLINKNIKQTHFNSF
jgi:hypothetical protein